MNLEKWINYHTRDVSVVVEFGAGFFDKLSHVHSNCRNRIGIEAHEKYLEHAKFKVCRMILGDMRHYREFITRDAMICAMFIDSLEHLDEFEAVDLIRQCQEDFHKILLMVPEGKHPQTKDTTGYGAHDLQSHRSTWYKKDLIMLHFDTFVDPNFHTDPGKDHGCLFGVWRNHKLDQNVNIE
jgi:hypothetical protein